MKRFIFLLSVPIFAAAAAAQQAQPAAATQDTQAQVDALNARVAALEGAPAQASISSFNPAMGMALDSAFTQSRGKAGFQFRAAELGLEAPVDPFLKGWAVMTGSPAGLEVEEAAMETTSLPYNLTVRGGRFFASFGRLAHFHTHELPVIERPKSLEDFIGGETQADGTEVSYLLPTETYINATFGAYNKMGGENERTGNAIPRRMSEFTYLARLNTYKDIGDSHSVELGADCAFTPKRRVTDTSVPGDADQDGFTGDGPNTSAGITTSANTWRTLMGADLTYRYQPVKGGLYKGLLWAAEIMQNSEQRFDPDTLLPVGREKAYAGFSYLQLKAGLHWRPGVMLDLSQDLDNHHRLTRTWSAFLTCDVTEFQRLRLVYSDARVNTSAIADNHTLALQWTAVMGHHVHGFRDR